MGFSLGWNSLWHIEPQADGPMDLNPNAHLKCILFPVLYSKAKRNNNNSKKKKKKRTIFQVEVWLLGFGTVSSCSHSAAYNQE